MPDYFETLPNQILPHFKKTTYLGGRDVEESRGEKGKEAEVEEALQRICKTDLLLYEFIDELLTRRVEQCLLE